MKLNSADLDLALTILPSLINLILDLAFSILPFVAKYLQGYFGLFTFWILNLLFCPSFSELALRYLEPVDKGDLLGIEPKLPT